MRARLMAIVTAFAAILWSFGEGHKAMASRQLARDAASEWRAQADRLTATREAWAARQAKVHAVPVAAVPEAVESPSAAPSPAPASPRPVFLPTPQFEPVTSAQASPPPPPPAREGMDAPRVVAGLRAKLSRCKVRVEECRIGPGPDSTVRTVKIRLLGSKEGLRKAIVGVRSDPSVLKLDDATFEPVHKGEARAILTGTLRPKTLLARS